jgi:hypothetical protein
MYFFNFFGGIMEFFILARDLRWKVVVYHTLTGGSTVTVTVMFKSSFKIFFLNLPLTTFEHFWNIN